MNVYITIIVYTVNPKIYVQPQRLKVPKSVPPWTKDYLKIDVQGFELAVLKGAQKALQELTIRFWGSVTMDVKKVRKPEWHGKGGSTFLLDCGATAV